MAGLIPRYREPGFGLARLTLLLPSRRTVRIVTEAFVRASAGFGVRASAGFGVRASDTGGPNDQQRTAGLLLPRMAVIGDLDIDETLGPLLDPIGEEIHIPPAVEPTLRLLRVAELLRQELGETARGEASLLRQARSIVRSMDRMAVEDIAPERLLEIDMLPDLAGHWQNSLRIFARVLARWSSELSDFGAIDPPARRNRLLHHAARTWRERPPQHPVVAAGVTSAAPAVAQLLRCIAHLPNGRVILPDLDLGLDQTVWDALGTAGAPASKGDAPFGRGDAVTHPQYHLKLLLNRMGVARDEVQPWHRAGLAPARPERSRAISNLFLPPAASTAWVGLDAEDRRLSGVRLMETAQPEEEAQAIAILVRQALAVPERRVAVITPDRGLAARVVAHLSRWNIEADDTAGRPLPQTEAGRLLLLLADVVATRAAPVPLIALLGHPRVRADARRPAWLERVRQLDLALRGPRHGLDLSAICVPVAAAERRFPGLGAWWAEAFATIAPLFEPMIGLGHDAPLELWLTGLACTAETLCGDDIWGNPDGRALAAFIEQWLLAAAQAKMTVAADQLPALLRDALDEIAVRPPWGGHPRLAIYGLLEARMSRADLVICGGMTEGVWPASPAPDPLLAPPVLRQLGIPGADFRIGLAAHDLAAALGAPQVVLSHAARDEAGPAMPSRFLLRIRAMLGLALVTETRAVGLARAIDRAPPAPAYRRPQPMPSAQQRCVDLSVTAIDRLRGDPYQFYASSILGLKRLDPLDADATAALKGIAVHEVLQEWHEAGTRADDLIPRAEAKLAAMSSHPFMRGLWRPRLLDALRWIEAHTRTLEDEGRKPGSWEQWGEMRVDGIRVFGRADRIDRLANGSLAIVDYKTGSPPSAAMVEKGFALQLGLVGLIAKAGGINNLAGEPVAFEYWSLGRNKDRGFGFVKSPVRAPGNRAAMQPEDLLPATEGFLHEAIARWILGDEPFTARLNPDLPNYSDYDQLMRLDEWQGRAVRGDA